MSDVKISTRRATIRAAAMRTADRVARLYGIQPDKTQFVKRNNEKTYERYLIAPPSSSPSDWPVMDADPIMFDAHDDSRFVLVDDGSEPAVWPINHGIIFPEIDGFTRLAFAKTIDPSSVRGRVKLFGKHMVWAASIDVDRNNKVASFGSGYFTRMNKRWTDAIGQSVAMPHFGVFSQGLVLGPSVLIGHVLRQRYEWSAIFHFPTGLRLRFGCSAEAALELFKDRAIGDDETRRRAILHWVRKHWRKNKFSQAAAASEIRRHLRGTTLINWRGLDVTIVPAMHEIETAA